MNEDSVLLSCACRRVCVVCGWQMDFLISIIAVVMMTMTASYRESPAFYHNSLKNDPLNNFIALPGHQILLEHGIR